MWQDTLGSNGIFIYPTFPTSAFRHNGILTKTSGTMFPMIFNLMGYPATHVPIKLDVNGLPVGLQVSTPLHYNLNSYLINSEK